MTKKEITENINKKCKNIVRYIAFYEKLLAYKQSFWSGDYTLIKNIYHGLVKICLIPFTNNSICRRITKIASKNPDSDSEYVGSIVLGIYGEKGIWERKDFEDSVLLEFERNMYKVPAGYDNLLRTIYGDYMTLPPKDKQVRHHKNSAYWRKNETGLLCCKLSELKK